MAISRFLRLSSPYVGMIQIRFMGRRSHLPLSLSYKLPSYVVVGFIVHGAGGKIKNYFGESNRSGFFDNSSCFLGECRVRYVAVTIEKDTIIGEVLDIAPQSAPLFLAIGMHCLGCPASRGETVEEACMVHGIDCDAFLAQLNRFLEASEAAEAEKQ